ncbi:hypothetical protein J2T60_000674 [Natronospira proteinivora]|uniref:Halobacterial output domain-containing protein n=1 Tax=Natronospira proteinivora TaxID=1807133 RepID=A0ABT1G5Y3_9GAMM|nr:hypothetical protein [Natronospira proteinivora]MCP1726709.1 hypothetical protein [Natronospira proteinivora]
MDKIPSIEELEALIGRRVRYLNHEWHIIEVLDEEMEIVLQAADDSERVLSNAHGEPVRALPDVLGLGIKNPRGEGLNPELNNMEVLDPPHQ